VVRRRVWSSRTRVEKRTGAGSSLGACSSARCALRTASISDRLTNLRPPNSSAFCFRFRSSSAFNASIARTPGGRSGEEEWVGQLANALATLHTPRHKEFGRAHTSNENHMLNLARNSVAPGLTVRPSAPRGSPRAVRPRDGDE
jgi:hypothetical protein